MYLLEQNGQTTTHETFTKALEYALENGTTQGGCYLGHTITEIN